MTLRDFHNAEAERTAGEFVTFSFGRNWQKYLTCLDDTRLAHAQASLIESLGVPDLSGLTFIDAGCGSGIFSLSALRLGAVRVTSIDIDPGSIECARRLRERDPDKDRWHIHQGSLLRPDFIEALEPADVVYSWGVLHHTGAMWTAIGHSMRLVKPGGRLCLALYRQPRRVKAHLALKRSYNQLPRAIRPVLCGLYYGMLVARNSWAGRATPMSYVTEYELNSRGMNLWRDVEDWLGGLPCEFATPEGVEAFAFDHGFDLEGTVIAPPGANSEYLLRAPRAKRSAAG
jgi:2-polyprenyl-6-hydroxyphenyl methylase/3-demethylubiquinone-9 3-methyltransferase